MRELLGTEISVGSVSAIEHRVSDALEPAVAEVQIEANVGEIKNADATTWLERGIRRTLWVIATASVTLFKIVENGTTARARPLFGKCEGILVSDRAPVFSFWKMRLRQVCWAHYLDSSVIWSLVETSAEYGGPPLRVRRIMSM